MGLMQDRIQRMEKAMATYADEVGGTDYDPETIASDFLTDLMHWADANDVCWPSVTDRASKHHFDEQLERDRSNAVAFSEDEVGGTFDGFNVSGDADPGL